MKRLGLLLATSLLLLLLPGTAFALTFQPVQELGVGLDPSIAVDGQNVYAAWRRLEGAVCFPSGGCYNDVFLTRSTDGGQSFSTEINVSSDTDQSLSPAVAASGTNVYVAWVSSEAYTQDKIYFKRSSDGGGTFGPTIDLGGPAYWGFRPVVVADGSRVSVGWFDGSGNFLFRRSNDGASFDPAMTLATGMCCVSVSQTTDAIYFAFTKGGGPYDIVHVRRSTDGGAIFQVYTIATPAKTAPKVLFGSQIDVNIVWVEQVPKKKNYPENYDIFSSVSNDGGVTWSVPLNLSNNPTDSRFPRISVGGSSVYVAWQDGGGTVSKGQLDRTSDLLLRQSTDRGQTFQPTIKVTDAVYCCTGYTSFDLTVAGGSVYLVWYQQIPNTYTFEVYLRRGS